MALIKIGVVDTNKTYDVVPEGKYEVFLDKVDDVVVVDGIESSRLMFTIRKDVNSPHGGRKLFANIKSADNYIWLFNALSKAVGIPVDTAYETLTEFLDDVKGRSLVVKVRHKPNPKDATKPYVNIVEFTATTLGEAVTQDDTTII
jgi:hypothetical protein